MMLEWALTSSEVVNGLLNLLKDESSYFSSISAEALVKLGKSNASVLLTLASWIPQQSEEVALGDAFDVLSQLCTS